MIDSRLASQWAESRPGSGLLSVRARQVFPSGITHDNRYQEPSLLYVERASGPRKWDVDGNEYIDLWMGHGSLLLGHGHPAVVSAIQEQAQRGTHFGASHPLEVAWAELICQIVPSAQHGMVKFTSSGTEATLMAMRMARAHKRRDKIVKFRGHFHGWHDYATYAMAAPYDQPASLGIPQSLLGSMAELPAGDLDALRELLARDPDVAGVILVPGVDPDFVRGVRALTEEHGVVMILDEVITGFRYAPGGAQELWGVIPDLTVLAKILAGGLPGGAVVGDAAIFEPFLMEPANRERWRWGRIPHPGTFNANPLSAAAGIACLSIAKDSAVQQGAAMTADAIRTGLRQTLDRQGVAGVIGGLASIVDISLDGFASNDPEFRFTLKVAMQTCGVDVSGGTWWVSAAHGPAEVDQIVHAFDCGVRWLMGQADGR